MISPKKATYIPGDVITITASCSPNASLADISWGFSTTGTYQGSPPEFRSNSIKVTIPFTSLKTMTISGTPKSAQATGNYFIQIPFNANDLSNANKLNLMLSKSNGSAFKESELLTYSVSPNIAPVTVSVSGGGYVSNSGSVQFLDTGTYFLNFSFAGRTIATQYTVTPADFALATIQNFSGLTSSKLVFTGSTAYLTYSVNNGALQLKRYTGTAWIDEADPNTGSSLTSYRVFSDGIALYLAYLDSTLKLTVKKFQSGTWTTLGAPQFATAKTKHFGFVVISGVPYIGFVEPDQGNARLASFQGNAWQILSNSVRLNSESDQVNLGLTLAKYSAGLRLIYASSQKGIVVLDYNIESNQLGTAQVLGNPLQGLAQLEAEDSTFSETYIGVLAAKNSLPTVYTVGLSTATSISYQNNADSISLKSSPAISYPIFDSSSTATIQSYTQDTNVSKPLSFVYLGTVFPQSTAVLNGEIYIPRH